MARARSISTQTVVALREGWGVYVTTPGAVSEPAGLDRLADPPIPATVPGTVVSAVRAANSAILDGRAADSADVWYRCRFDAPTTAAGGRISLCLAGLATLATVYLNGEPLLQSENMFLRHEPDVTALLRPGSNDLCIRFASLNQALEIRRPRPRWKTHLVDHQQLRWFRTTLFGRMPGWHHHAQRIHAVGPWRAISLVHDRIVQLEAADLRPSVDAEGCGVVDAALTLRPLTSVSPAQATLHVGDAAVPLEITQAGDAGITLVGRLRLPDVALWWPHTHGAQPLYPVRVALTCADATSVEIYFGETGFRTVDLETDAGRFCLSENGAPIFFRGAVWTTVNSENLVGAPADYDRPLALARDAGMNMLRLPGIGFYETDDFYDRCARNGIAIWQDFAFGLMDYPTDDPAFSASAETETRQFLDRVQLNPTLTMLCGNSERATTAVLHGLTLSQWFDPFFEATIRQIANDCQPHLPYVPSSEYGGPLPFHVDVGVGYYYGVGACLRPLADVRRSSVQFASECLAFANVPENECIDKALAEGETAGNDPSWKAAVPRNVSQGWDFDDVRDHYAGKLFEEDMARARFSDIDRYLCLGRAASGEVMEAAFSEWRREQSPCAGALVFFYKDLWPGAGWGVLDAFGMPKSCYYYLKRALATLSVFFTDEGMNGLRVHLVNDGPAAIEGSLRVAMYRHGRTCIFEERVPVHLSARGNSELSVDGIIGGFMDTTYAYKFGPPTQDVTVATLEAASDGRPLTSPAFYFPLGRGLGRCSDVGLEAWCTTKSADDAYYVTIRANRFAQMVNIEAKGFLADDNYFHLEPGHERQITLTPFAREIPKRQSWSVGSLNSLFRTKIEIRRLN